MDKHLHIVVMAGGTGTRFWPYSRNAKPKQFLDVLGSGRSLLRMTADRFRGLVPDQNLWIVSNQRYEEELQHQFPDLDRNQILLEPDKKNTAPCITYAACKIREKDPDAIMAVLPSDQVIFNEDAFQMVIADAVNAANDEKLLTIGIQPNRPETGYGYIQFNPNEKELVKKVISFKEKPDQETAQQFLIEGGYVWNAGIFVWSIQAFLNALGTYQPELLEIFVQGSKHYHTENESDFITSAYQQCESISIDYAIMEKSDRVYTLLGDFGWTDLGSWNALHEILEKDDHRNVIDAHTLTYHSRDNFVINRTQNKEKLIVIEGLEGYLVADFEDVLLITPKEDSGNFRKFVEDVKKEKGEGYI